MNPRRSLFPFLAVAALAAPAFAQSVLQARNGLRWDVPYPPGETVCTPDGCCTGPDVRYRMEWTLAGVPFGGNAHDFDLLYPEWPVRSGCRSAVRSVHPVKVYQIAPGTRILLALSGVYEGTATERSNVVEVYWPWICEGPTSEAFRDCVLQCAAVMGADWCSGP